jgi:hypothetical protein
MTTGRPTCTSTPELKERRTSLRRKVRSMILTTDCTCTGSVVLQKTAEAVCTLSVSLYQQPSHRYRMYRLVVLGYALGLPARILGCWKRYTPFT